MRNFMNLRKLKLEKQIYNPFKVNRLLYLIIGFVSISMVIISALYNLNTNNFISEIALNLSIGCVASTFVALLIEIGNIREKNFKANCTYDTIYVDLRCKISRFLEIFSNTCSSLFQDKYISEKYTWFDWYKIIKENYSTSNRNKQKEIMNSLCDELLFTAKEVEKSIEKIESQQYILSIHNIYDEDLRSVIEDIKQEFHNIVYVLNKNQNDKDFWKLLDSLIVDLKDYIYDWIDIRYYNYCKFSPFKFLNDDKEILQALILCKEDSIRK